MKTVYIALFTILLTHKAHCQEKLQFKKRTSTPIAASYILADSIDKIMNAKARLLKLGPLAVTGSQKKASKNRGFYLEYKLGWIYYNSTSQQAYGLWDDIYTKWVAENAEAGWMGNPITDRAKTPLKEGANAHFEAGSIYYSAVTGAHIVKGDIKTFWANLGWENSPDLGFPTSDEIAMNHNGYTIYQKFENGVVFWGAGKPILVSANILATTPNNEELIIPKKYLKQ